MYLSGAALLEELGVISESCNRCLEAEAAALGYGQEGLLVTTCNHVYGLHSFSVFLVDHLKVNSPERCGVVRLAQGHYS